MAKNTKKKFSELTLEMVNEVVGTPLTMKEYMWLSHMHSCHITAALFGKSATYFDSIEAENIYGIRLLDRLLAQITSCEQFCKAVLSKFDFQFLELAVSEACDWIPERVCEPFTGTDGNADAAISIIVLGKLQRMVDCSEEERANLFLLYPNDKAEQVTAAGNELVDRYKSQMAAKKLAVTESESEYQQVFMPAVFATLAEMQA